MRRYYAAPAFLYDVLKLKKNTRTELSGLVGIQEKKLRAIIQYAYENVAFYHAMMDAKKVKPTDIRKVSDLKKLPVVTKKEIQENYVNMISSAIGIQDRIEQGTSGSTGLPLNVVKDRNSIAFQSAVSLRTFLECGGKFRDKTAQLRWTGSSSVPTMLGKPFYERLGILRTEWVLTDRLALEEVVDFLRVYKPDVIMSYPSVLQLLSEHMVKGVSPRIIFSTAELLSRDSRAAIESAFGSRILDSYGCTEAGDLAWECPSEHEGYHINVDSVVIEFVKDGENVGEGEDGEIVVTNLFSHAMPFIRYKIGDIGVPDDQPCSCGRTLPLMRLLKGRADDFVLLPDGRKLSSWFFLNTLEFSGVSEYRIVQEKVNVIRVLLKMRQGFGNDYVTKCASDLGKIFGENVETIVEAVDEIPSDSGGKLRRVVSKVTG